VTGTARVIRSSLALVAALAALPLVDAGAAGNDMREEGAKIYARYCEGCHGANGDGHGPAAPMLIVKPRDFTKGVFKFGSTPTGTLPTNEDLYRIITRGVYRTSMPEWSLLTERERMAVVEYIKGFSPEWAKRGSGQPIFIPAPPATLGSAESVARGREVYQNLGCRACHGEHGRGDGPSALTLEPDVWGNKQKPFDFTSGRLKSGPNPQDVYRTFMVGVGGTAMPAFGDVFNAPDGETFKEGDAWHLVSYVLSLRAPVAATAQAVATEEAVASATVTTEKP
jgi:mono/diheme cytochrome c family protein